jgi:drug/metabolite transporter (DMT)-like permease
MAHSAPQNAWLRAMPILFVLIWSTGFIVARYGMPYAPPMKFLATRYALSLLCFAAWVMLARVTLPSSRTQWLHLAVVGVLVHAGYLGGVWTAVKLGMGSGLTALIVGLQPVLTALWMSYAGGKVTARQWGGLALGSFGLLLVVYAKLGHGEVTAVNLSFAAFALLSITVGTLYQKRFVAPCDARSAISVQLGAALFVTLPLALLEPEAMPWNAQLGWAMAWSVVGLTLGGSSLLYLLIQRGAATSVTSLLYLVPPTTAFLAWILFGEAITAATVLGTALTALAVFLVVRAPAGRRP